MTDFFGKRVSGPFTIPSGIITTNTRTMKRVANDIPQVGVITTKSIGPENKPGNKEPILHCVEPGKPGTFVNAVGLRNPGADNFAEQLSDLELPGNRFLLASVFGAIPEDMEYIVERLDPYVDGFELNFSCPHSPGHGASIGHNPDSVYKFTKAARRKTDKPILSKFSANMSGSNNSILSAMRGGSDGITAINTLGPLHHYLFDDCNMPVLYNIQGSFSGEKIRKTGIKFVKRVRELIGSDALIIGMGGITCAYDIDKYREAGADFFGIGTVLAGMTTRQMMRYMAALERDMETGDYEAKEYIWYNKSGHKNFRVSNKERLADDLCILTLDDYFDLEPGQFVFAYLPKVYDVGGESRPGEKPFSLIENDPATLVVHRRGSFSGALTELDEGDRLYLRGPCGDPVDLNSVEYGFCVAGGTGAAALYPIARALDRQDKFVSFLFGGRDEQQIAYADDRDFSQRVFLTLTTDDGSRGERGFVTDYIEREIRRAVSDETVVNVDDLTFFNCGPAPMIEVAEGIEGRYALGENIWSSMEYLTRCGYGLCGECARDDGLRSCVDGPFLNPYHMRQLEMPL